MFELLPNVQKVPIDPDALMAVHRGMNKVRVSVGQHNSEPSEVYIVTGKSNGDLETYIIFFMLEPGIHVVYGCDQNPYARALEEQVLEEATIFVEEMGSILEEVPWGTMTAFQRSAWVEKETLYSEMVLEGLEEVEEIEDLEIVEVEDVDDLDTEGSIHPDDVVPEPDWGVVEVSEEEVDGVIPVESDDRSRRQAGEAGKKGRDAKVQTQVPDKESGQGGGAARLEDVVVAEGDFDEMLKQAFLKPDVVEKTRRKARKQASMDDEEPLPPDGADADEAESVVVLDTMETFGTRESGGAEADLEHPVKIGGRINAIHAQDDPKRVQKPGVKVKTPSGSHDSEQTERDTRLRIIRFLSRF